MFSAQSWLVGNGTSVTCLRKSREPITALNVATYVTPLMVRNFWLWRILFTYGDQILFIGSLLRKNSTLTMARDEEDFPLDFFFSDKYSFILNLWRKVEENCEAVTLNLAISPQFRDTSEGHSWFSDSNQLSH